MKRIILKTMIVLATPLLFSYTVHADETSVGLGDGNTVIIQSDGQDGNSTQQNTETNNNSSSNTTSQLTQEQINSISYRNGIYNQTKNWFSQLKNLRNSNYPNFSGGYSDNITNLTIGNLHKSEIARLLNYVNQLSASNGGSWYMDTYNWGSSTQPITALNGDNSWNELSSEEKETVREGIVKNENQNFYINRDQSGTVFAFNMGAVAFFVHDFLGGQLLSKSYGTTNITNNRFSLQGSNYTNVGDIAIPNIFLGTPQIHFTNRYIDNFNGYKQMALLEGWITNRNPDNTIKYTYNPNILLGGSSASLNDNVYIALLTDYHVDSVTKNHITNIDFTSDERRWTITLNGQPVGEPLITDNPKHELNFTEVYEQYGAGDYEVIAEQLALVTRATYVKYDILTYLFDAESGNILYAEHSLVRSRGGNALYLDSETSETPEWMPTGDTFIVHVNDLGELSYDGDNPGTERTE